MSQPSRSAFSMDWSAPELSVVATAAVLVALWLWLRLRREPPEAFVPVAVLEAGLEQRGWRSRRLWAPAMLATVGVALLIVALGAPRWLEIAVEPGLPGTDFCIIVDGSMSMNDYEFGEKLSRGRITRFDLATEAVDQFVAARRAAGATADRAALVVFGHQAQVLSPLTQDLERLPRLLSAHRIRIAQGIQNGMLVDESPRTNIGRGLLTGLTQLTESQGIPRVAILVSDGAETPIDEYPEHLRQHYVGWMEAARICRRLVDESGLRLYVVGIGVLSARRITYFLDSASRGPGALTTSGPTYSSRHKLTTFMEAAAGLAGVSSGLLAGEDPAGLFQAFSRISAENRPPPTVRTRARSARGAFLVLAALFLVAAIMLEVRSSRVMP